MERVQQLKFLARLRHPVRQKDPDSVTAIISLIRGEVEKQGFVLTSDEPEAIDFTAEPGRTISQSNLLERVALVEKNGNWIAKKLNVQFDFVRVDA